MKPAQLLSITLAQWIGGTALFSAPIFSHPPVPTDHARQIVLLAPSGATPTDREILHWQQSLAEKPTESVYWERLAWAYVAQARGKQDAGFYKLAELTVDVWEAACGANDDTLLLRGHVYHNLHRFKEAETLGRDLVARRKAPADYALLCDALMEQGKLDQAVEACQVLTNLRPGVEAFSRIAHLRWLFGDLPGAVEAMRAAVGAAEPREGETRAWLYSRLAGYELLSGHLLEALALSETALGAMPDYPLALALKGRILYSSGNYVEALAFLRRAAECNPIPDNQWWLADALQAQGQGEAAYCVEAKLRRFGPAADPRTFALFLATRGENLDHAVRLATDELKNRGDVFTRDALSFALARSGKQLEAAREMAVVTTRPISDPRLALHAGILAAERGDRTKAEQYYALAKSMAAALTPSEQALLSRAE